MKMLETHYQRVKNVVHGVQGLGVLVGWIITIAVFTRPGKSGGQTKYFFALVRGPPDVRSNCPALADGDLLIVLVYNPRPRLSDCRSHLQSHKTLLERLRARRG